MDDDVKDRFEGIERLIGCTEKRFDDVKWYVGGAVGVFTLLFSVFTLMQSWNFNRERDGLRDFQKDIKADIGKLELPPELELFGVNGMPLSDQEINSRVEKDKDGNYNVYFDFVLKNKGSSSTGPLNLKIYTNDPIEPPCCPRTDEPKYKYEMYVNPKDIDPNDIPGGMSTYMITTFVIRAGNKAPNTGKYKSLIKYYYGKGKITQAPITLVVP
jgi:hypothetical protein